MKKMFNLKGKYSGNIKALLFLIGFIALFFIIVILPIWVNNIRSHYFKDDIEIYSIKTWFIPDVMVLVFTYYLVKTIVKKIENKRFRVVDYVSFPIMLLSIIYIHISSVNSGERTSVNIALYVNMLWENDNFVLQERNITGSQPRDMSDTTTRFFVEKYPEPIIVNNKYFNSIKDKRKINLKLKKGVFGIPYDPKKE